MADFPITLTEPWLDQLAAVLDVEGKIPRALDALGPVADRDVVLLDGDGELRLRQLTELGARVAPVESLDGSLAAESADAIVTLWSGFRGVDASAVAEADRILRPGGRLLIVHDYGRDDVSLLRGDQPEYGRWTKRGGPFLSSGFKIRVLHCWWTFESLDAAREFLSGAFGVAGTTMADGLRRPRLSYNVAVYHRTRG